MSFVKDFAKGFLTTAADITSERRKLQENEDAIRKQRLAEVDAKKVLMDYADDIKAKEKEREDKSLEEKRRGDFPKALSNPTGVSADNTTGKVDVPDTVDHSALEQQYLEAASKAAMRGDEAAYKSYKAQADVYKARDEATRRTSTDAERLRDKSRTEAREGVTSVEGMNPAEEMAKEDAALLTGESIDPSLYKTYFGIARPLSRMDETDLDAIQEVTEASAKAVTLTHILTNSSKNEYGISEKGNGELKADGRSLVRLKTQYDAASDPEDKDMILNMIFDIAEQYPASEQLIIKTLGIARPTDTEPAVSPPAVQEQSETTIDPNEGRNLSPEETAGIIQQAKEAIARGAPREQVIQRLENSGISAYDLY